MKVKITIGTDYCGCPPETIEIECESAEEFERNDSYSTEILNALSNYDFPHYFIEYDYVDEDEDECEDEDEDLD